MKRPPLITPVEAILEIFELKNWEDVELLPDDKKAQVQQILDAFIREIEAQANPEYKSALPITSKRTEDLFRNPMNMKHAVLSRADIAKWLIRNNCPDEAEKIQVSPPSKTHSPRETYTSDTGLLCSLAVLSLLISDKFKAFKYGEKPNKKAIADEIIKQLEQLGISVPNLSNLRKDISHAIDELERQKLLSLHPA